MRTVIGWIAAMLGSALLGAAVYQAVLSDPPTSPMTDAAQAWSSSPTPRPTVTRTQVRTVVEPTPTITVLDQVLVAPRPEAATSWVAGVRGAEPRRTDQRATPARTRTALPAPSRDDHEGETAEDDDEVEAPEPAETHEPEDQEDVEHAEHAGGD